MENVRHANLTLPESQLDELHGLKRRLSRERGQRLTLDDVMREAIEMLLRYHQAAGPGSQGAGSTGEP